MEKVKAWQIDDYAGFIRLDVRCATQLHHVVATFSSQLRSCADQPSILDASVLGTYVALIRRYDGCSDALKIQYMQRAFCRPHNLVSSTQSKILSCYCTCSAAWPSTKAIFAPAPIASEDSFPRSAFHSHTPVDA